MLPRGRSKVDALECKWSADAFEPRSMRVFRELYPEGRNLVVTPAAGRDHLRRFGDLAVQFCSAASLRETLGVGA